MNCFFGHQWKACGVYHERTITAFGLQPHESANLLKQGIGQAETIVLMKCKRCGDQKVNHLDGTWTLEQLGKGKAGREK